MSNITAIHIFTSFFMCGLCWLVQIVHYPLFRYINLKDFPKYQEKNYVTGFVTVPVMIVELMTGLYLLYINQTSLLFINMILLFFIWLSTMIYQVPIHVKITSKPSIELFNKLIKTNWIRTISWTLRAGVLIYWITL